MSADEPTPQEGNLGADRRKTHRFSLVVPVEVEWTDPDGVSFKEEARAKNVNVNGALLHIKKYPRVNTEVVLKNLMTGESTKARLAAIRRSRDGNLLGVIVELPVPNEAFWGLTFQLQRSTAQLLDIEQALHSQNIDFRVLRELRAATEHLRRVVSAVRQWQDVQLEGGDTYSVLPVLTDVRLRGAVQLLNELAADLDALEVTYTTEGFDDLVLAVERVYQRLAQRAATLKDNRS